ncbi:MAG: DUF4907 domain-containing protein [Bacteroidales bacterium]|nr:DUF4907 domain-containing protein [Bacteroidales bacterium]
MMIKTKPKYQYYLLGIVFITSIVLGFMKLSASKKENTFRLEVMENNNHWEYMIYKNEKLLIHQTIVPAMQGKVLFNDSISAYIVGRAVIMKLQKGLSPSISLDDIRTPGIK